jgi:hypothetical protein
VRLPFSSESMENSEKACIPSPMQRKHPTIGPNHGGFLVSAHVLPNPTPPQGPLCDETFASSPFAADSPFSVGAERSDRVPVFDRQATAPGSPRERAKRRT